MRNVIEIRVKTLSNLFIGGSPMPFEIGGIDLWTAVDEEGFPCIPASSLKGALRSIVSGDDSREGKEIARWYQEELENERNANWDRISSMLNREGREQELERIGKRYEGAVREASAAYLFGIREFNNTPKLLFHDLRLRKEYRDRKKCFSIDTKTAISQTGSELRSNPRTYKAARGGLVFEGEVELYRFTNPPFDEKAVKACREYIIFNLKKFNNGAYRLGNSKSRGYGRIEVTVVEGEGQEGEKL